MTRDVELDNEWIGTISGRNGFHCWLKAVVSMWSVFGFNALRIKLVNP